MDVAPHSLNDLRLELEGSIDGISDDYCIHGWAWCPAQPSEPLTIAVWEAGEKLAEQRAAMFRPDLAAKGILDGRCGFSISLPGFLFDGQPHSFELTAELDGCRVGFGAPVSLSLDRNARAPAFSVAYGAVRGSDLASLRSRQDAPEAARDGLAVVFDVSDLIQYFQNARLPTGIQRVQIEVITNLIFSRPSDVAVQIACFTKQTDFWVELPELFFNHICRLALLGGETDSPDWERALRELAEHLDRAKRLEFPRGAFLLNLGTSWWLQNYFLHVRMAKARYGIRYVPFVHDCIPVMTPEHCTAELTRDFISWIIGAFQHADHFMANSAATARDLGRVASYLRRPHPDPAIVRLDADHRRATARLKQDMPVAPGEPALAATHGLRPSDYVLFVSTVESRKNHLAAFSAWLKLVKRHGPERVPMLVCVGNRGWLNDAVYSKLAASSLLRSRVLMLSKIPDAGLEWLYQNCLMTLYPSSYEGWGLPVTESLSYGKVPLISRSSSLPEAGGTLAEYFDLGSENDFVGKLERLIFDDAYRAARERTIREEFRPRSWEEIAHQMLHIVRHWQQEARERPQPEQDAPPPWLTEAEPGRYYPVAENTETQLRPHMLSGELFRQGDGWWWPEPWGCWAKDRPGRLEFLFRVPDGEPVVLFVGIHGVQGHACTATVTLEGICARSVGLRPDEDIWLTFRLDAGAAARLPRFGAFAHVSILCAADRTADFAAATGGRDHRRAGLGVRGFMICRADNVEARMTFIESIALGDVEGLAHGNSSEPADLADLWREPAGPAPTPIDAEDAETDPVGAAVPPASRGRRRRAK